MANQKEILSNVHCQFLLDLAFFKFQYNGSALLANISEHMDIGTYVATVVACSPEKPPNDTNMIYTITGDTITLLHYLHY